VVLTGASSGLGRKTCQALLRTGDYHVVAPVRDLDKMAAVAEIDGYGVDTPGSQCFTPMYCELASFESVQKFLSELHEFRIAKPIARLVCNAGVYQPSLPYAKYSADHHEQTMQINFLSHFYMIANCLPSIQEAVQKGQGGRVIMVGSVTGNDNTVGGGGVYPVADLHELDGFAQGFKKPIAMADGYGFIGAKAYKDSKLCLMMMANFLHTKYHKLTGVSFTSMYPGCIAESPLFREKRPWFRKYFPVFMKFITGTKIEPKNIYTGTHTSHGPKKQKKIDVCIIITSMILNSTY
jgi:protochlorophyllide reductase